MIAVAILHKETARSTRQVEKEVTRLEQLSRETRERIRKRRRLVARALEDVAEKSTSSLIKSRPLGLRKTGGNEER